MFGGSTPGSDCTDDLYVMDTRGEPRGWVNMSGGGEDGGAPAPKPRYAHSMCAYGTYVVIFGGRGDSGIYLNDMWVVDTADLEGEKGFSWQ